eukprot:scaffold3350_cov268-Pinguiococcus_pyrenoidosus.AAC.42
MQKYSIGRTLSFEEILRCRHHFKNPRRGRIRCLYKLATASASAVQEAAEGAPLGSWAPLLLRGGSRRPGSVGSLHPIATVLTWAGGTLPCFLGLTPLPIRILEGE